ncbi:MAG: excisionase family DNA-binding protein [Ardenticatenales bacterium]|nr:excisionase family DNA-binding protein [Ardenticatenales bacterium]
MARVFDIIEYTDAMRNEMVHRIPERGSGDFRIGSQLIVRESQEAVFVRDGQALDSFGPGRHTITTANIPLLTDLVGKAFSGRTPFTAEVFFVSKREFLNLGWGTQQPIIVRDPEFGAAALQGFGTYTLQIANAQMFIAKIVGTGARYTTNEIQDQLRGVLLEKLQDVLGELKLSVLDLAGMVEEIRGAVRAKAAEMFQQWGVELKSLVINSLKPAANQLEVLAEMGLVGADRVRGLQAMRTADATLEAAKQEGGGMAGMGAGLGAGMAIAQQMTHSMMGAAQQPAAPAAPAAPAGAKAPSVMTPAQAAAYLQVTEADIMAMITDGSLKAKKLGSSYRLAKAVIDEFMAS